MSRGSGSDRSIRIRLPNPAAMSRWIQLAAKPVRPGLIGPASMPLDDHSAIHQGGSLAAPLAATANRSWTASERCGTLWKSREFPTVDIAPNGCSAFGHGDAGRAMQIAGQRASWALGPEPDGARQEDGERPEPHARDRPWPLAVAQDGGPDSRVHRRARRGIGRWTRSPEKAVTPTTDQQAEHNEEEQDDGREPEK